MNTKLANAVRAEFDLQISKRLPGFRLFAKNQPGLYALKISCNLVFFVFLSIADGTDSFTLEVAANDNEQFPWTETPGSLRDVSASLTKKVWRFRIPKLWGELKPFAWTLGERRDHAQILKDVLHKTYLAPENVESKLNEVEPKVRNAVDKLCHYGIPHFESSAERHGCKVKIEVCEDGRDDRTGG